MCIRDRVKGAISSVRPFTFLAVRFAIGGISLLLWLFVRKIRVSGRAQANAVIGGMEPVKSHGDTIISADSTVLALSLIHILCRQAGIAQFFKDVGPINESSVVLSVIPVSYTHLS